MYEIYIEILTDLKKNGVPKSEALDCLEFDSDESPDLNVLKAALNEVYDA